MSAVYVLRPKADQDLDEQAYYLATEASPEVGHRFLYFAHETFGLLSEHPRMGWRARLKHPQLAEMRVFPVKGFEKMLVFYRPHADGVEILRVVQGSRNLKLLLRREGRE